MDNAAAEFRSLLRSTCTPIPGAFNGLCARAVRQAGFKAAYVSGAATSVCAGVPDVGLLTLEHFCRVIREVRMAGGLPVLADADTGFGEAEMVRRTVIEYARAGAAGLHIEDQQFPKRCGHLDGKALV
ncbi:MAG: isocitrate lyase/PEP mutase family protein, partial [Phycisphaerales bacterium]